MSKQETKLFVGKIEGFCGYGLLVVETSEDKAMKALKKEYYQWRKASGGSFGIYDMDTFDRCLEYFGGGVFEIEIGLVYHDGFGL